MKTKYIFIALIPILLFACDSNNTPNLTVIQEYAQKEVPAQHFSINNKSGDVVEGNSGTVIVVPEGAFLDGKGNTVEGNVDLAVTEAITFEDMLILGLTTESNGKLLESGGMLHIEATANGEKLSIDPDKPLYIEIPTPNKKDGMMAYKGIEDSNGLVNWVDPKPLKKYLIPVDMDLLNFYPPGFEAAVEKGMPFHQYETATKELTDSLYYLMSEWRGSELTEDVATTGNMVEPFLNANNEVVDGKYTKESFEEGALFGDSNEEGEFLDYTDGVNDSVIEDTSVTIYECHAIDPAVIKVLRSGKFDNTFIATREFEKRLKQIFTLTNNYATDGNPQYNSKLKPGDDYYPPKNLQYDITLELYINNLDKDLYIVDSLAMEALKIKANAHGYESPYIIEYVEKFKAFYNEKLTNVEKQNFNTKKLSAYYNKQLRKTKEKLKATKEKLIKELKQKTEAFEQVKAEYRKVLWDREKYRMERLGFEWGETGWLNVDKPIGGGSAVSISGKEIKQRLFKLLVDNGSEFDRVESYVLFAEMRSISRLFTSDKVNFSPGSSSKNWMFIPDNESSLLVSVGYKDESIAIASQKINTAFDIDVRYTIELSDKKGLRKLLKPYSKYNKENLIEKDLEYQAVFAAERKRQKALQQDAAFLWSLHQVVYKCENWEGKSDTISTSQAGIAY